MSLCFIRKNFLRLNMLILLSSQVGFANETSHFQYGQCLLGNTESYNSSTYLSYNTQLKNYRNISLAKADINAFILKKDPSLLKWNYETLKFIYSLSLITKTFQVIQDIYRDPLLPEVSKRIQKELQGASGHLILTQLDSDYLYDDKEAYLDFMNLLESNSKGSSQLEKNIKQLKTYLKKDWVRQALGEFYDTLKEAALPSNIFDPNSLYQWVTLNKLLMSQENTPQIMRSLVRKQSEQNLFFLSKETFLKNPDWKKELPSLLSSKYPKFPNGSDFTKAETLLKYLYNQSIEKYLFSTNEMNESLIQEWMNTNKNSKIILKEAQNDTEAKVEKTDAAKIYKYLLNQEKILSNAFDHFVWKNQGGTSVEKAIDGVARTLYSEAENCHNSGAFQFEAIGAVIAARSIAIDQQNKSQNFFASLTNPSLIVSPSSEGQSIPEVGSYKRGASDFGRLEESFFNSLVSTMPTPAQVVSKPIQFSVWKMGKSETMRFVRWIPQLQTLGFPSELATMIVGPSRSKLDVAQEKALCPKSNEESFTKALELASEIVANYHTYAQKYRFLQGSLHQDETKNKYVTPYYFTHGKRARLKARAKLLSSIQLINTQEYNAKGLPITLPLFLKSKKSTCSAFKLYSATPKDLWNAKEVKREKRKATKD